MRETQRQTDPQYQQTWVFNKISQPFCEVTTTMDGSTQKNVVVSGSYTQNTHTQTLLVGSAWGLAESILQIIQI
jgi:hypothetical protein